MTWFVGPGISADFGMQCWYVPHSLVHLLSLIHTLLPLTTIFLQVWALEIELITGISRVSEVRFPALARWGASRAWKKDFLHVYIHRERLDSLSTDDVPAKP